MVEMFKSKIFFKKLPQHWYVVRSLEVNISGGAIPVQLSSNGFNHKTCANNTKRDIENKIITGKRRNKIK